MNPSCFFGTGAGGKGEEHRRKAKTTTKWLQLKQDDRRETRLQGRNNSDVLHKQMKHATCVDAPNQYHFVLWHDIYTFGAINDQQLSCFLSNNRLWHWHLIGSCSFDCLYCYHKCYPMNAVNTRFRQCHQGLLTGLKSNHLASCQTAEGMGASLRALAWKKVLRMLWWFHHW